MLSIPWITVTSLVLPITWLDSQPKEDWRGLRPVWVRTALKKEDDTGTVMKLELRLKRGYWSLEGRIRSQNKNYEIELETTVGEVMQNNGMAMSQQA